jgi:hypothetical protein
MGDVAQIVPPTCTSPTLTSAAKLPGCARTSHATSPNSSKANRRPPGFSSSTTASRICSKKEGWEEGGTAFACCTAPSAQRTHALRWQLQRMPGVRSLCVAGLHSGRPLRRLGVRALVAGALQCCWVVLAFLQRLPPLATRAISAIHGCPRQWGAAGMPLRQPWPCCPIAHSTRWLVPRSAGSQ